MGVMRKLPIADQGIAPSAEDCRAPPDIETPRSSKEERGAGCQLGGDNQHFTSDVTSLQTSVCGEAGNLVWTCRSKHHLYNAREIEFLKSVAAQSRRVSDAQIRWLRDLAAREVVDFAAINSSALSVLEALCRRWLGDGKLLGKEWVACNPTRADASAGSFRINVSTGRWADFATKDGGGDPISLAAFLFHQGDQRAAALSLKAMLRA